MYPPVGGEGCPSDWAGWKALSTIALVRSELAFPAAVEVGARLLTHLDLPWTRLRTYPCRQLVAAPADGDPARVVCASDMPTLSSSKIAVAHIRANMVLRSGRTVPYY